MRSVTKLSTAMLLVLPFFACNNQVSPGGKVWLYSHSTGANTKDFVEPSLHKASFLQLQNDGTFNTDLDSFQYGQWACHDKQLFLTSATGVKSEVRVIYLTSKELQTGPQEGPFRNFEAETANFANAGENPFSIDNNRWRIPATHKEDLGAIRARLRNHFRFWEQYFNWGQNNHIEYIDVRNTPTPIMIYGNGFTIKNYPDLPLAWKRLFYDDEDCRTATAALGTMIREHKISWPQITNRYEMFSAGFRQIEDYFR